MGIPIPLGCGSFKLVKDDDGDAAADKAPKNARDARRPLIMAS